MCLVTGAAGFIGSHLAEALLAKGYRVLGIDNINDYYSPELKHENLDPLLRWNSFLFLEEDINDLSQRDLPSDIDFVFHLAGQPGVRSSWSHSFDTYLSRNLCATQRLLELMVGRSIQRFIFSSSSSIYGQACGPVAESCAAHPLSPYAATKVGAEGLCLAYSAGYSIPMTILRYFTVYGPRQRPDMAIHKLLHASMTNSAVPIFGDGTQRRAFTYVSDVVDATLAAMNDCQGPSIYNVSGGDSVTLNECLAVIEEATGQRILRLSCREQRGDPYETEADISKAYKHLGYLPHVSLSEGIAQQWQWMCAKTAAHAPG
jgi:UDP-glucose 4-epimerase